MSGPVPDPDASAARPWEAYLTDRDRAVLSARDAPGPPGTLRPEDAGRRPAVLAIDLQDHLFGPDAPITEAVETYRTAMGEYAWDAVGDVRSVLASARDADRPVVYTRVIPGAASGLGPSDVGIVDELAPADGEAVIDKAYSSAFYGTDLLPRLVGRGIDTLVIVGCSTGGCVRATAVDGWQLGFDVVVPAECTFDRVQAVRALSLLDVESRYGRVVTREAVESYFEDLPASTRTNSAKNTD